VADERKIIGCRRRKKGQVAVKKGRSAAICPSGRNAPMTRKRTIGAMRDQTPFVFWFA
jgi:hypothetical protein